LADLAPLDEEIRLTQLDLDPNLICRSLHKGEGGNNSSARSGPYAALGLGKILGLDAANAGRIALADSPQAHHRATPQKDLFAVMINADAPINGPWHGFDGCDHIITPGLLQ
jgi:hypothetical protein